MSTTMTQAEHAAKARAMAQLLLGAIPPEMPHGALLEALLRVYIVVAETHPCCTLTASHATAQASQRLAAAALDRPAGTPIH